MTAERTARGGHQAAEQDEAGVGAGRGRMRRGAIIAP